MLQSLGFSTRHQDELHRHSELLGVSLRAARVLSEHRNLYNLQLDSETLLAPIAGRLRHNAQHAAPMPKVGDWVGVGPSGRVEALLTRNSVLQRKAAGSSSEVQVIATNVDWVMIVSSANREFNPRRIERYIAATLDGRAKPVLVLNKVDLCGDVDELLQQLEGSCCTVPVARVCALRQQGFEQLQPFLEGNPTVALVGSSGVGKSTISNWLLGSSRAATNSIRNTDDHGKHTTTNRCLYQLPSGGALIDTPGMRELGVVQEGVGEVAGFEDIEHWVTKCRFADCQHTGQPGCAVQQALDSDQLSTRRWQSYLKLQREVLHQQQAGTIAHKRELKRRGKQFATRWRQRKRIEQA